MTTNVKQMNCIGASGTGGVFTPYPAERWPSQNQKSQIVWWGSSQSLELSGKKWEKSYKTIGTYLHVELKTIVGQRPFLVAKRATNMNDTLVQSEFVRTLNRNWLTDLPELKGMYPCGHCTMCRYVDCSGVFIGSDGMNKYCIKQFINCATMQVLYILECPCKKICG